MIRILGILLVVAACLNQGCTLRILGIFPLCSRSHEMMFEALMKGLAKRGHQVDVVTHFPVKNPPANYRNIINLSGTMENLVNNFTLDFVAGISDDVSYHVATTYGTRLCHLMDLKEMKDLINNPPKDPPYDVFITEVTDYNLTTTKNLIAIS